MQTVQEVVSHLIQQAPFLEESLAEGIINFTALARNMREDVERYMGKSVQIGAIVMAIKRHVPKPAQSTLLSEMRTYVSKLGEIIIRSDLVDYTFKNSDSLLKSQEIFIQRLQRESHELFMASSKGVYETNVVVSATLIPVIEEIFEDQSILNKRGQLSSLTIRLPQDNTVVPGVYYVLLKTLAWEGINLVEMVSTTHEITLILDEVDLNRAFGLLQSLTRTHRLV
ncbi:hypothetical protein [Persicobacter psychrovividus]|uniref:Aspartate kinase n=1 Tax=Persicobacter psychrovividus TaxID=387638 RepID=A0ABM7VKX5_9BACT|nr:hypothetical protein PEPS_39180 [Persicobacter psychrovividus]